MLFVWFVAIRFDACVVGCVVLFVRVCVCCFCFRVLFPGVVVILVGF